MLLIALLLAEAAAPVSPAVVETAVQCGSRSDYDMAVQTFYANRPPRWVKPVEEKDLPIGMDAFQLTTPISVFGQSVMRIYLMSDWIVVALPVATAEGVIARQHLAQAPIASTRQYYRFVDPETGPMIGAFEPPEGMFLKAFGIPAEGVPPATKLYVGCNYTPASETQFLAAARGADAAAHDAGADIEAMMEDAPTPVTDHADPKH